jgi:hypothetical protein
LSNTGEVHWIRKGDPKPTREVKTVKASIMVWGCVWYNGKSELCICDKTIDASYYKEIFTIYLLPCIPNSTRYHFQQDNAAVHKSKKVMDWLPTVGVKLLEDWPAYSPDMNPIEHGWSWMSSYVNSQVPTNKASLERAINLAWQNLPQNVIRGYIENLPRVCQQIIAAKGDHI